MITSRGLAVARLLKNVSKASLLSPEKNVILKQQLRNSGGGKFYYRSLPPDAPPQGKKFATTMSTIAWWWICWHFFTEYEELIGPKMPDPSKWTDEELGIPPI